MTYIRRMVGWITWFAPIHRWTTAVTVVFFAGALVSIFAVVFGFTEVAKAPQDVVIETYSAAQQRNVDEVRRFLAEPAKVSFDAMPQEEIDELLSRLTNGFTTSNLEFLGVRNYGSHAVVGIMQDFTHDFTTLRVEVLVRENGRWRIEWPLGEAEWAEANLRFDPYYRSSGGTN